MESTVKYELECVSCDTLSTLDESQLKKLQCPSCGETKSLKLAITANEFSPTPYDEIDIVGKVDSLPSKKKKRLRYTDKKSLTADTGEYNDRKVLIDKINDRYEEKIINSKTGEVMHHDISKLSDHIGHGSDKFKKDT